MGADKEIAVLGLGRLGLCFAVVLEQAGFKVAGMDVNPAIVNDVNTKTTGSTEPGLSDGLAGTKHLRATTDMADAVKQADLIFILVPTPNSGGRDYYDHSILSNVLFKLNTLKLRDKHVVISATVLPGYCHGTGNFLLRDCVNTTLSYNPAFVAQGNIMEGYKTGGWFRLVLVGRKNDEAGKLLTEVYEAIAPADNKPHICLMSPESAEIAKLCSNCFRTTKISFCNMVADMADRTPGADKHEICNALAKDDSIGPIGMRPGYGYGGPCYPRDNQALSLYAKSIGIDPCIPEATHSYNEFHHSVMSQAFLREGQDEYVFEDVAYKPKCAVSSHFKFHTTTNAVTCGTQMSTDVLPCEICNHELKGVWTLFVKRELGSQITVIKQVAMIDESPKLRVALQLVEAGKRVLIRDRMAIVHEVMKTYGSKFAYEILEEEVKTRSVSPTSNAAALSAQCANEGQSHLQFGQTSPSVGPINSQSLINGTDGSY